MTPIRMNSLQFELFKEFPFIKHHVFSKKGGTSVGPFSSLNMGFHCGDLGDHVKNNRRLAGCDGYVGSKHIHGTTITEVDSSQRLEIPDCDGMMTNIPGVGLLTTHADCQAALFYDPINHAIANVHCGWRGNVQNIYGKTVEKMCNRYGSKPENLFVGISPSLGPNHAEFKNYKIELPQSFLDYKVSEFHFNFWEIARMQLQNSGVLNHHIEIAEICTYENQEDYFSYRRDKICGRNGTTIELLLKNP